MDRINEQQIREIIKDELQELLTSDRYVFHKFIQIMDGRNIQLGRTTGTQIGTATDQKLGFYGTIPVDKPATVSDANSQGIGYVQADVQSIATAVNAVISRLKELGLIA